MKIIWREKEDIIKLQAKILKKKTQYLKWKVQCVCGINSRLDSDRYKISEFEDTAVETIQTKNQRGLTNKYSLSN